MVFLYHSSFKENRFTHQTLCQMLHQQINKDQIVDMQKIVDVENNIQLLIKNFCKVEENVDAFTHSTRQNNSKVFWALRKLFEHNLTPLHLILVHLTDHELLTAASTCRTAYKLVFSPFGYKLIKSLRPLIIEVHKIEDEPIVSISMFEGETKSSKELFHDNMDEDDLQAAVMAMNTNILAMMHKIKQIEIAKKRLNAKSSTLISTLQQQAQLKQYLNEKNMQRLYRIEKQEHIGQDCQKHIQELMLQQQMKCQDKQERIQTIKKERDKLLSQKELLIKKLKAVMVEVEEEKTMSMEVANIMGKLEHILKKK